MAPPAASSRQKDNPETQDGEPGSEGTTEAGRLGGWEAGIQVLAGLAPSGAFLLSLQTAAFLRVLTWSSVCACGHVPPCCDQALSRAHLCMSPFELDQQRQKCNRAVRW